MSTAQIVSSTPCKDPSNSLAFDDSFDIPGNEYFGECWADNLFRNTTSAAAPATDCTFPCNSNKSEICGAGNRLSSYIFLKNAPVSSSSSIPPTTTLSSSIIASTTSTSISSTTASPTPTSNWLPIDSGCLLDAVNGQPRTFANLLGGGLSVEGCIAKAVAGGFISTPTPTNTNLPSNWTYLGCFKEGSSGRALASKQIDTPVSGMTNGYCAQQCFANGFLISGTEFASQCYCGNDVRNGGGVVANGDCNMPCSGNPSDNCGAGNRLSVYSSIPLSNITIWPPPVIKKTNLPNGFSYVGCFLDNVVDPVTGNQQRTFPSWQWIRLNDMTVELCLSHCLKFGFMMAGVEYGSECFCGDAPRTTGLATVESDCQNIPCPGNPGEYCASGGRLLVYTYNTTVSTFSYPANTGRYEFFIGGLI
ncbi:hypothetical protein HDU76_004049, partial [Blyttiomyces sp. JEL0837]